MSDRATLRRLLQEHKEDAILRLFDTVQNEHDAQVAALQAELTRAIDIYKDPAVAHANILNGRIVLPKFYVNITDDFGPVAGLRAALDAAINMNIEKNAEVVRLTAALAAANEDAARLASVLEDDGYPVKKLPMNAKRLSLAAHRARVGGAS